MCFAIGLAPPCAQTGRENRRQTGLLKEADVATVAGVPNPGLLGVDGVVGGGLASIPGALYGAVFIQFTPNIAEKIAKAAPWAIYCVFLILLMFVMPTGVAGAIRAVIARFA
jgi:hypothetical protein